MAARIPHERTKDRAEVVYLLISCAYRPGKVHHIVPWGALCEIADPPKISVKKTRTLWICLPPFPLFLFCPVLPWAFWSE